jgi:hypothetical protein
MRFYFTLFCLFAALKGFSQEVIELPLLTNPILIEKTRHEFETIQADLEKVSKNTVSNLTNDNTYRGAKYFNDTLYVVSGDSIKFEVDTAGLFIDTLFLENKTFPSKVGNIGSAFPIDRFGKASTRKTNLFKYLSPKDLILELDTVSVIIKPLKDPIDTFRILMVIKRKDKKRVEPTILLPAEKDTIICVENAQLTGKLISSQVFNCQSESIAKVKRNAYSNADTCLYFRASRLGGLDQTCFVLCDEYQVCDTFVIPIRVLQDTLSEKDSENFIDDFSYAGPFPDAKLWLNDRVFVNNTMSFKAPSIGMATFDGLNYTGRPYGNGYGISDILTSTYLNLSKAPDELYLSFYIEPKGLGYSPDVRDSFIVEFKTPTDEWKKVFDESSILYLPGEASPGFTQYSIPIEAASKYNGFQFRFKAFGGRTGLNDIWNLDYVRISSEKPVINNKSNGFKDVAFTQTPGSIFKRYTSMPWKHVKGFEDKELNTTIPVHIYNHFDTDVPITDAEVNIKEIKTPQDLVIGEKILPVSLRNRSAFSRLDTDLAMSAQSNSDFSNNIKNIPANAENLSFVTSLSLKTGIPQEQNTVTLRNDLVESTTTCSNYFAYDDGTAESVVTAQGTDSQLQVRFQANVDDSLRAVSFHFPHFNKDITNMRFNLRVFVGKLGKEPTYERLFLRPDYPDKYAEILNGFTQYLITDGFGKPAALFIPKGDFYVGWQQVTTGTEPFVVGFDKNNPSAISNIFKNTTGLWTPLTGSSGAVMIRPKLSSDAKQVLSIRENEPFQVNIFPNPANDYLNIQLENANFTNLSYTIFDLSGRAIQQGNLTETIDIQTLNNGFYIIKIQNQKGEKTYHQKISIIK